MELPLLFSLARGIRFQCNFVRIAGLDWVARKPQASAGTGQMGTEQRRMEKKRDSAQLKEQARGGEKTSVVE